MDVQTIIVAVVLAACVVYTARRLWLRFTKHGSDDPHCEGCPLIDTCQHKEQRGCCETHCKRV